METSITILAVAAFFLLAGGYIIGSMTTPTQIKEVVKTEYKEIDCPRCNACPPEKICEPCQTCKACNCPTPEGCPEPEPCPRCLTQDFIDGALYEIANMRPRVESSGWQDGYYTMRNICLDVFGYKNISKFREARSTFDPDLFYNGGTTDINDGYFTFRQFQQYGNYCFNLSQYPDENGRKRWTWDLEDCKGSTMTICHL